jgi:hypothetical protein
MRYGRFYLTMILDITHNMFKTSYKRITNSLNKIRKKISLRLTLNSRDIEFCLTKWNRSTHIRSIKGTLEKRWFVSSEEVK